MSSITDVKNVAKATNRSYEISMSFKSTEDFVAIHKAENYLKEQGYSIGSMCHNMPIACAKNASYIAKWRNIEADEWQGIEAMIVSDDMRNGPTIEIYKLI